LKYEKEPLLWDYNSIAWPSSILRGLNIEVDLHIICEVQMQERSLWVKEGGEKSYPYASLLEHPSSFESVMEKDF
jgi:hypothetical protein